MTRRSARSSFCWTASCGITWRGSSRGVDPECDPTSLLADAAEGIHEGYLGLDTTVRRFRQVYWTPRLFERRSLAGWSAAGCPDLRRAVRAMVAERLKQFDYALDADLGRELDRIYARAERELA